MNCSAAERDDVEDILLSSYYRCWCRVDSKYCSPIAAPASCRVISRRLLREGEEEEEEEEEEETFVRGEFK